ncbi:MAG: hypothetical protein ACYTBJ_13365 [Planctomycetota bacterium]
MTVNYSNVLGGWTGAGNISVDPCFVAPNNGDFHLKSQLGRWNCRACQWQTDANTSLWNPDPTCGNTGANVFGVNLSGDYATAIGGPYRLTAGPLDCSGYRGVSLRFARWLNTDQPDYVTSGALVSADGSDWTAVWEHAGDADITDNQWQIIEYDISGIADHQSTVYIRWSYEILDERTYPYSGWNIDDIELRGNFW